MSKNQWPPEKEENQIPYADKWQNLMSDIVISLECPYEEYKPETTIDKIRLLIESDYHRPMYSYLSDKILGANFKFESNDNKTSIQERYTGNCATLFEYTFALENEDIIGKDKINDIKTCVSKIFDDINLACLQNTAIINNLNSSSEAVVKNAHDTVKKDIQDMQKTYISAFAVLASILFGLVGGIAFSFEGIRQGVSTQSLTGLLSVICLICSVFLGVLASLFWLIAWLSSDKIESSKKVILIPCIIALFLLLSSFGFARMNSKAPVTTQQQESTEVVSDITPVTTESQSPNQNIVQVE